MAKHKYIKSPEQMWELFQEYKKQVKDNPRIKIEYVGRDGERVETPIERPLIIEGFKSYCAEKIGDIHAYWINRDNLYDEFSPIITRIKNEIRSEQLDGGMAGLYNSNLTARINGLADKQEQQITTEPRVFNIPKDD